MSGNGREDTIEEDTRPRAKWTGARSLATTLPPWVERRRRPRIPLRLQVRFGSALDFVVQYAENLCDGGVFVRGAHRLDLHTEVEVELALPGYGTWEIRGRVAHVVTPDAAARSGTRPGAGLEIIGEPPGFHSIVREYLRRLGRRRDVAVMAQPGPPLELLQKAGYQVVELAPPQELVVALARCAHPVIGIVMTRVRAATYWSVARSAGVADLMCLFDYIEELDELLADLDGVL